MFVSSEESKARLKLDLGCGTFKKEGFLGIDRRSFEGVDGVTDLTQKHWVFKQPELGGVKLMPIDGGGFILPDNSVAEAYSSHFLEHLNHNQTRPERVRFMNELWRVMVPDGKVTIITPHWASNRAYGDFTHADKPVSEMFYVYLSREWRLRFAPDNDAEYHPDGYTCNFDVQLGHAMTPSMKDKSEAERAFAIAWYKEAVDDLHALLHTRK
jgi:SAM-dependent methyltransferase